MSRTELPVAMGSHVVGTLSSSSYSAEFILDPGYRTLDDRPVIGQWFEDRLHVGRFESNRSGLPVFFENLLPSDYLRRLIRVQHHLEDPTDLDILAAVGRDLPGALVIGHPDGSVALANVGFAEDEALVEPVGTARPLAFSLAGLQLKFSLVKDGRWLTLPVEGRPGLWISKIPTRRTPVGLVENEYSVMMWAQRAGFDVPAIELLPTSDLKGIPATHAHGETMFVIQRFDRSGGERIHQEDFAQILGVRPDDAVESNVSFGYAAVGLVVRALLGERGVREYLRRLVFMAFSGNGDAHLKNWSVRYPNRRTPVWTPLYDQVATVVYESDATGPTLPLGRARRWSEVDRELLVRLGVGLLLEPVDAATLVDGVLETIRDAWNATAPAMPLLEQHRLALAEHFESLPLLRRIGAPSAR